MNALNINGIEIEFYRKDIKNVHLSVHPPAGRVRLAVPEDMDEEAIRLFVISKLAWIKKQRKQFKLQERQSAREFVSGESHYFLGSRYLMNVIESSEKQRVELRNKKYMDLYVRPDSTREQREKVVNEWYRTELKQMVPQYIEKWEDIMGVAVEDWGIRLMRTKWGTCNESARRIWLNLELAKKNPRCLEYIIVHEMVHFLERNHNERFKAYMDQYLPNWRGFRAELNELISDREL